MERNWPSVLDLGRVEDHREPVLGAGHLGQGLRGHGMAARERAVERQPEQHDAGPEQPAADDVGGVVPAEQARRSSPTTSASSTAPTYTARRRTGLADQHRGQHDQDARERRGARGVAGRERLRDQLADGVLPGRAVPAEEQLHPGRGQRRRDHHPDGEDGRAAVPAQEQRHRDAAIVQTVIPMVANATSMSRRTPMQARTCPRPVLGGAAQVVEPVQRGALEVDQEGQQHEQRRAHPGPGQGDATGAVEHGRQYAGSPWRVCHPCGGLTDVLTVGRADSLAA